MVTERAFPRNMFADSLLDTSSTQRVRRSWTTLTSFGAQAVALGLLLLVPLWRTVGLPTVRSISTPVSLGQPNAEQSVPRPSSGIRSAAQNNPATIRLVAPSIVPAIVSMESDDAPSIGSGPIGSGEIGVGSPNGPPLGILSPSSPVMPAPPPAPHAREFRTSTMLEGSLIRRVQPVYPFAAKTARVQGTVVLAAVISKAGTIEGLQVLSGHPLLVGAAVDAVSQWRYRPYILNGEPIEVETRIRVNFTLAND